MRRSCLFLSIALSLPILMGMGILGEKSPRTKMPETAAQFTATITDTSGVSVTVEQLSYDGELYLPVYKGKGLITLPFDRIAAIEFGKQEGGKRTATVTFANQKTETFLIEEKVLFVGKVPYGIYQIETKDMKRIEFHEPDHP